MTANEYAKDDLRILQEMVDKQRTAQRLDLHDRALTLLTRQHGAKTARDVMHAFVSAVPATYSTRTEGDAAVHEILRTFVEREELGEPD